MAKKSTSTEQAPRLVTRRRAAGPVSSPGAAADRVLRGPTYEEIAEAAYRRFLDRGGEHGRDFDDWVEAERELHRRTVHSPES